MSAPIAHFLHTPLLTTARQGLARARVTTVEQTEGATSRTDSAKGVREAAERETGAGRRELRCEHRKKHLGMRDKIYSVIWLLEISEHRRCTVCSHPRRKPIEKAIARGRSLLELAQKYGLTKIAIHRHDHHAQFRLPAMIWPTFITGQVRGNSDKTKPFRWKPGQSGNPRGRPPGRKSAFRGLRELMDILD